MKFRKIIFVLVALVLVCLLVASVAPSAGMELASEPESVPSGPVLASYPITTTSLFMQADIIGFLCQFFKCSGW